MASTGYWFLATKPEIIDARGLRCPLPVLKLEKRLEQLRRGETVIVLATDPMAQVDIPLYCRQRGHECQTETQGEVLRFTVLVSGLAEAT